MCGSWFGHACKLKTLEWKLNLFQMLFCSKRPLNTLMWLTFVTKKNVVTSSACYVWLDLDYYISCYKNYKWVKTW